jgi:hypothetical protein
VRLRRYRRPLVVLALAAGLTALSLHKVCDALFDCGCTWIFTGADTHCNTHAPRPPHCPACTRIVPGATLAFGLLGVWAGLAHLAVPRRSDRES